MAFFEGQACLGMHQVNEVRVVTIIDLLQITIIDESRGLHTAETPVASSLDPG